MSINPITNYFNTTAALGYRAGPQITVNEQINTDNLYNTYLGANTDILGTTTILNSTAIGYNTQITESHQIVLGTISENISIPGPYVGIGTYNPTNALALDVLGNVNVSNGNIIGSILTPYTNQIPDKGTISFKYSSGLVEFSGTQATLFEANIFTGNFQPTIKIFANNSTGITILCLTSNFIGNLGTQTTTLTIQSYSVATLVSDGTNWYVQSLTNPNNTSLILQNLNIKGTTILNGPVNIQNFINIVPNTNTMNINGNLNIQGNLSASTISSIKSNTGTVTDASTDGYYAIFTSLSSILTFNQPTPGNPVTALLIANSTSDAGNSNTVDGNCAYSYMGLYTATIDSNNNISINLIAIMQWGLCCGVYCPASNTNPYNNVYVNGNTTDSLYVGSYGTYNLLTLGQIGVTAVSYTHLTLPTICSV